MRKALGWHRDVPDHRDFTLRHAEIVAAMSGLPAADGQRPESVDWRDYCPPVDDQEQLATGSVHACIGMVQYFERRAHGRQVRPSRLFVYKNARRLLNWTGDSGVPLRVTLKAIRRFGVPPEGLWPYCLENVDCEPQAFAYSFCERTSALNYFRIDARNLAGHMVLESACALLAGGFCFVCGFPLSSFDASPLLPYPTLLDGNEGCQAVLVVGYDDRLRVRSDRGAFRVRNSWGNGWGDGGYGWLPYAYIREGLAADLWTLVRPDWLASGEFRFPHLAAREAEGEPSELASTRPPSSGTGHHEPGTRILRRTVVDQILSPDAGFGPPTL